MGKDDGDDDNKSEKGGKDKDGKDKADDTTAQQATLAVLSCFQKLSDVNLENYEKLKAEFEDVMKTQLPKTGSQMEVLKGEADRVFGYARQYIEQIRGGG